MASGRPAIAGPSTSALAASVTSPTPPRSAPVRARWAAPVLPADPATTRSRPGVALVGLAIATRDQRPRRGLVEQLRRGRDPLGRGRRDADVDDRHVSGQVRSRLQLEPDLREGQGDGGVGPHGRSDGVSGVGGEPGGQVHREHARPLLAQARRWPRWRRRSSPRPAARVRCRRWRRRRGRRREPGSPSAPGGRRPGPRPPPRPSRRRSPRGSPSPACPAPRPAPRAPPGGGSGPPRSRRRRCSPLRRPPRPARPGRPGRRRPRPRPARPVP